MGPWLGALLDLLWPGQCPLCGGWLVGDEGRSGSAPLAPVPVLHADCLRRLPSSGMRPPSRPPRPGVAPVCWMWRDDPAFFRLLHAAKYGGRLPTLEPAAAMLAAWAAPALRRWPAGAVLPVPDDPARRARRGGSASGLLAEAVARAGALPLGRSWLTRKRGIAPLARLSGAQARRETLQGVVGVGRLAEAPFGLPLVLVDDQITSGSTLAASARLLRARGHPVLALALAGAASAPRQLGP